MDIHMHTHTHTHTHIWSRSDNGSDFFSCTEGCAFDLPIGDSCTGGADMLGFVTNAEAGGSRKGFVTPTQ